MLFRLAGGGALILLGLVELAWFIKTKGRRWTAVQAAMFCELGMSLAVPLLFDGAARTAVTLFFVVAAALSAWSMVGLTRNGSAGSN